MAVSNKVFTIAGNDSDTEAFLSTVSWYDIARNTWKELNAELNTAKAYHSACTLNGIVYVFCGYSRDDDCDDLWDDDCTSLNSIEMISEASLVQNSKAKWQLIDLPENILSPRKYPAVVPINDTKITIWVAAVA